MTIKEALEYRNNQNVRLFKVAKNWVMAKGNMDKKFKDFSSIEKFIESVEEEINTNNSRINAFKTVEYLVSIGLEIDYKSIMGSTYFYTSKGHLRVSNHHFTSEKHKNPSLNLCSYEVNGFEKMIEEAIEFLK